MSKFEVYKDKSNEYRWRFVAANGQVIATSGQGYKAKTDCEHGIELIKNNASTAEVEEKPLSRRPSRPSRPRARGGPSRRAYS